MIELIYCAAGTRRFADIAVRSEWLYGIQAPGTAYAPVHFIDQNWRNPDRSRYMAALAAHRPRVATVLDWERHDQCAEVLSWAEEASAYVDSVVIIPKLSGLIPRIPRRVGGAEVRLGYSVPTRYGGTEVPVWEFSGWPVHLLGGSPQRQMTIARYLYAVSADGNYAQKMAVKWGQFWTPGTARTCRNRYWPKLSETGRHVDHDIPYEAFALSCQNIRRSWEQVGI